MTERLIEAFSTQGVYVLRIMLAAICGGFVGFERSKRQKDAGIRTHIIVALGSALVMIVSKYAFGDLALSENLRVDASRIASILQSSIALKSSGPQVLRSKIVCLKHFETALTRLISS